MRNILIVCTANICRSPMAEIVANHKAQQRGLRLHFDSAGTHAAKGLAQPDSRAKTVLEKRGYKIKKGRSRKIDPKDFERFDLILAMDRTHLDTLQKLCPSQHQHKLKLFLASAKSLGTDEVADPYYGNLAGFERVLDLCEAGADHWLLQLA
ncbi:low molecular weight protein-tyrosine-phosphatase [Variovorax sp. HJSM1_2]|uniref:low molecular weight protein-tyrosine-phosphatase n=1 Tax=Variovorax sp. HJSM1_2 TaxID=3366263 RepID=UPI003BCDB010